MSDELPMASAPEDEDAESVAESLQVTELLAAWRGGQDDALEALAEAIYPGLRRLAAARLSAWSGEVSLQATELAHEAYFKLLQQHQVGWKSRAQLFAVMSRLIRRLLVDHARHRDRKKRGGGVQKITLDVSMMAAAEPSVDIVVLETALEELARIDELASRVVEVLFFGGLTHDEASEALGVGRATVGRKWRFARAWLATRLAT